MKRLLVSALILFLPSMAMADTAITNLPPATDLQGGELFKIVQTGDSRKATIGQVNDYVVEPRVDCAIVTGEGRLCWDTNDDLLYIGDGATAIEINNEVVKDTDCSSYITEGLLCWDTDDEKLYSGTGTDSKVIGGVETTKCAGIELLTDADDNWPIIPAPAALTITAVGCRITGSAATVDFEDSSGNAIKSSVTCDTGSSITWTTAALTNTAFTAGEVVQFDTNGVPTSPGIAMICVKFIYN